MMYSFSLSHSYLQIALLYEPGKGYLARVAKRTVVSVEELEEEKILYEGYFMTLESAAEALKAWKIRYPYS